MINEELKKNRGVVFASSISGIDMVKTKVNAVTLADEPCT
jgi:hypothetical protein